MAKGGDVRQVSIDGVEYSPVGGGNGGYTAIFSGFTNENLPTGNGGLHQNKNRKLGGFDGLQLSASTDDYERLQAVVNGDRLVPVTITLASGAVHTGAQMAVEGELNFDGTAGTVELSMRGVVFEAT